MTKPNFSDVISHTKMRLPEILPAAPSAGEQLLSQPFVPPVMTKEQATPAFIPDDLDLSDLKAPDATGANALLGIKMVVPNLVRPQTMAERVLKMQMTTPTLRGEEPHGVFIPADVDLSVAPQAPAKPDGFAQLLSMSFVPPILVKPQTVAERVLSTKMTLPEGSFSQAVALTADVQKRQERAFQPEM